MTCTLVPGRDHAQQFQRRGRSVLLLWCIMPLLAVMAGTVHAQAQIPVEWMSAPKRSTLDLMFFRNIRRTKGGGAGPFLFFHRTRSVWDHRMTATTYLPAFGLTNAVSWNPAALKGFAPVAVLSWLNRGLLPKGGIQYARVRKHLTLFGWLVADMRSPSNADLFALVRWTPKLKGRWHAFLQAESLNTLPAAPTAPLQFVQRLRLGLQPGAFQTGFGVDASQSGRGTLTSTLHPGLFLRYSF